MVRENASWFFRGSKKAQSTVRKRKLSLERYEARALLASDCIHNIAIPEDTDGSGDVSALDALAIINQLNGSSSAVSNNMTDVDTDSQTTPLDALAVINHLNRHGVGNAASAISLEARIARIEKSIAEGTLGNAFTLDDAIDILATLRSGKRPELGDRVSVSTSDSTSTEKLVARLTAAGVSTEIIETVVSEINTAKEAGTPLTRVQVMTRLTELGVDVKQVFSPGHEHAPTSERFIEKLTPNLTTAGVATETIETITTEIRAAVESGTPLTLSQVKSRLEELGVDTAVIFPAKPDHQAPEDRFLTRLTSQLTAAGVDVAVIETITQEIKDAKAAGERLSVSDIKARLVELGVDVSTIDLTPPPRGGRGGLHRRR
jgi:hypothetical protein